MQNIFSLFQKRREISSKFLYVYLGRLRLGSVCHRLVKLIERHGLAQVVGVLFPI